MRSTAMSRMRMHRVGRGRAAVPARCVPGDLVGGCCTQKGCPRNFGQEELEHAGLIAAAAVLRGLLSVVDVFG